MAVVGGAEVEQAEAVVSGLGGGVTVHYTRWGIHCQIVLDQQKVDYFKRELANRYGSREDYVISGTHHRKHCGVPRVKFWERSQRPGFAEKLRERGFGCSVCGERWEA